MKIWNLESRIVHSVDNIIWSTFVLYCTVTFQIISLFSKYKLFDFSNQNYKHKNSSLMINDF